MIKIAFYSTHDFDRKYFNTYNNYVFNINYIDAALNETTVALANGHEVVCVFANDLVDHNIIIGLAKLNVKLIALRCTGYNNVDLEAARENQIHIVRVPEYSPYSVAEHAVAMLLTLNRKIHKAYNHIKEGNFALTNLMGFDLNNKNVGIIGAGKIGSAFAKIMSGFGCKVYIYDPLVNPELLKLNIQYVSKEKLFQESDIISLHCPLNNDSLHIINSQSIQLMRNGVFIINTGRGALIDTKAVKDGLLDGRIGYLALDVYEHEANIFFHDMSDTIVKDDLLLELIMYPNVLVTSHQGFFTKEAITAIAKITLENINNFFNNNIEKANVINYLE